MVIEGVVIEGRKMGRQLGFPTANVALNRDVNIESGVYLSSVRVGGNLYNAVTNIGTNPSVGSVEKRSESYLLDFEGDLYGQTISIKLGDKLRQELRFESVEALRQQISMDIERARQLL